MPCIHVYFDREKFNYCVLVIELRLRISLLHLNPAMIPWFDSEAWFLKALGSLWGGWGAIRWSFWWGLESEFHSTDCFLRSFNKDLLHETGWRKLKKNPRNPPLCSVLPDFDVLRYPEISWSPGFGESSRGRNWKYILTFCSHEMSWTQSNTELRIQGRFWGPLFFFKLVKRLSKLSKLIRQRKEKMEKTKVMKEMKMEMEMEMMKKVKKMERR